MRRDALASVAATAVAVVVLVGLAGAAWGHDCPAGHETPDVPPVPELPGDCVDGNGRVLIQAPSLGDPGLTTIVQRCLGLGGSLRSGTPAVPGRDGTCKVPAAPNDGTAHYDTPGTAVDDVLGQIQDRAVEWTPTVLTLFGLLVAFGLAIVLLWLGCRRALDHLVRLLGGGTVTGYERGGVWHTTANEKTYRRAVKRHNRENRRLSRAGRNLSKHHHPSAGRTLGRAARRPKGPKR